MHTDQQIATDAMLMRGVSNIRRALRTGDLDPQWVEFMLERVVDNDRSGDLALRPVYLSLERPDPARIETLLDTPHHKLEGSIDSKARGIMRRKTWTDGPDRVNLTIVNRANLFLGQRASGAEEVIRQKALALGLKECPDWVVPATFLSLEDDDVEADPDKELDFNFCLESDGKTSQGGLGFVYADRFRIFDRGIFLPRNSVIDRRNWAFVKP